MNLMNINKCVTHHQVQSKFRAGNYKLATCAADLDHGDGHSNEQ